MDLLAEVLAVGGVRGAAGARIEASGPWGILWHGLPRAAFYAVTCGTAWLELAGHPPRQLMPGDVVLLPNGPEHTLRSAPDVAIIPNVCTAAEEARDCGGVLRLGSGEVETHVLGASYDYDPAVSTQVLATLPEVVHIRANRGSDGLDDTVRLLSRELASPQIATEFVLNRLVDILLVQLLRAWRTEKPAETRGTWLGILGDPLIGVALAKIHEDPAKSWTTDLLAAELATSRSTLTRRFRETTGRTPGDYLTLWRMDLAAVRLRDTDDTVDTIARSVGYTSVYAFSRAFRRARDQAPGQYRTSTRKRLTTAG
ncbi:AraC family transcriptional regulator [Amycolatopsis sp. EV170708-02-1]|uniref:AraC family transcriptional regulator n=1 Tax=Amycolatopsis sp. EV170708-02-1 TaxID=2919322 RepID=UPI001F0CCB4D|nr:AraC family transcriptional regulator [Amycolatopsis sp. EV170708-02-1]UMP03829.1 AraC family transcriptional regulator [Amycolatopsis sp. EV170708-02-1]